MWKSEKEVEAIKHKYPKGTKLELDFMDEEGMKTHRYRLHFNAKAEAELLAEAIHMLENAKETHDMLEAFYIPAMDFKKVEKRGAQITQALLARAKRMEK